ncbi:MAG: TetR/AcrR family transcriptional regulator [Hyphomonas sp.]
MARHKILSDEQVLQRLLGELLAVGPAGFTFAKAAKASGLSAATLVQRYGDRASLIEAILLHAWDTLDSQTETADAEAADTPEGAIGLLLRLMPDGDAERNATDGLLLLREDLQNPILRARGSAWGNRLATALGRRLTGDTANALSLGWEMASLWQGAYIWWAFNRGETAEAAIRRTLINWINRQAE